jgi:PAS domain S-box-containing protein
LQPLETRFNQLTGESVTLFWRKIEKGKAGKQSGSSGDIAFTEEKLVQLDGSPLEVEVAATPLMFQGRPAVQIIARDITERKNAEAARRESEECFRMLVAGVQEYAIYMLDAFGCVASWNAGAERTGGFRADEIMGKPFATFFTLEDKRNGLPEQLIEKAKIEGRSVNEGWRVRKDGSHYWSHGVLTALRDGNGKLRGFSKVARDITCQKEAGKIRRRFDG